MRTILYLACTMTLIGGVAEGQRMRSTRSAGVLAIPAEDPADSLYRVGRQAINDGKYSTGVKLLQQLVEKYPKSAKAGDALYWQAWALYRLGTDRQSKSDLEDAIAAIDRQQREFSTASTVGDSRALRPTIQAARARLGDAKAAEGVAQEAKGLSQSRGCTGSKVDEETRMAALDGLMNMNADDAVPILKDVLKQRDACRVELRKKAVFLLSQKRAADVATTLLDVARNDPSSEVREEAVQWLSQTRSELAIPMLDSILFSSGDEELRKKAIFALSQLSRDERARASLRRAAESDRMPEEIRGDAIHWLGQQGMADLAYFRSLFDKTRSSEIRGKILFAVSQTNTPAATTWLVELARDKKVDVQTRKDAIFNISQRRGIDLDLLSSIYDQARGEDEVQDQVIFAFAQRREPIAVDKLMAIAKSDPNVERRKQALFWLGQKNDPRIKQFILDLIKG